MGEFCFIINAQGAQTAARSSGSDPTTDLKFGLSSCVCVYASHTHRDTHTLVTVVTWKGSMTSRVTSDAPTTRTWPSLRKPQSHAGLPIMLHSDPCVRCGRAVHTQISFVHSLSTVLHVYLLERNVQDLNLKPLPCSPVSFCFYSFLLFY